MRYPFYIILMFLTGKICGQQTETTFEFIPVFHGERLVPGQYYFDPVFGDSIAVDLLKFYVSAGKPTSKQDASEVALMMMDKDVNELQFKTSTTWKQKNAVLNIGVDSLLNTSGALGGDLDPSVGMYWTWNTGYINVKIEGRSQKCSALKHEFQFHLGGYSGKQKALQQIPLSCIEAQSVSIEIELADFFAQTDLSKRPQVMSPGPEGTRLASAFASSFHLIK